jgi:hypothetical protein
MWIRPLSEKSFAVLAALFLSLFVFVFAAGEAGAEEQVVLPMDPWCAMPHGTAPTDTVPPGAAPCPPTVLPPSAVDDSVSLPARGTTELTPWQQQQVLPSPGADSIGGPRPEPIRPHLGPPAEMPTDKAGTPKKFTPEEALSKPGTGTNPGPPATEDFVAPTSSANQPELASPALQKSSAPDDNNQLPAANSVPSSSTPPVQSTGEQAPTATDRTSDPIPTQVEASGTEQSTVGEVVEVVEPLVQQALMQTHTTITETVATVASAFGTLESWTAGWRPSGEAAQTSTEGTAPDPLVPLDPLLPPMPSPGDSPFFSLPGTGQVGSGGGLGLLLLGVLASGLILLRRDGPLSWITYELPKPTSALLLPLERPG